MRAINRHAVSLILILAALIAITFLNACSPEAPPPQAAATPGPTATVTPASTPLPPVPTLVPAGATDNPLRIVIHPAGEGAGATRVANQVERALGERLGIALEIVPVDSDADALAALCESFGGAVNVAWLGAMGYVVAHERDCGSAALMAERGSGSDARTGEVIQIIANAGAEIDGVADLREDATFCRVNYLDTHTWFVPALILSGMGVRPLYDLEAVNDYEDAGALIDAVAAGDCTAAGVPASALEAAGRATGEAVRVLAESAEIPYGVLVYPNEMPLDLRTALSDALLAMVGSGQDGDALGALLGLNGLRRIGDEDLADLRAFVRQSGFDLSQLES